MAGGAFLTEALIGGMIVELSDNAELLDDAAALDISDEVKLILYPYMEDDGTIREPNFTEAVTALYARRDEETIDTAERVRWGHEANIISAVGPYVVSKQNKYAGIDDADCSGANWVEIFDFTVSKYGWLKDPLTTLFPSELTGIWQSGVGWKAQTAEHSMGGFWTQARIAVNIPPRTITGVKIYYNTNLGTDEVAPEFAADLTVGWLKTTGTGQEVVDTELVANGTNVYEFTGSEASVTAITASLIIWHDADPSDDPTIAGKITKIVLEGTGTNPFE